MKKPNGEEILVVIKEIFVESGQRMYRVQDP